MGLRWRVRSAYNEDYQQVEPITEKMSAQPILY